MKWLVCPDWYIRWKRPDVTSCMPTTIHLETTTKCNLSCIMCPRTNLSTHPTLQDPNRWNRVLSLEEYKTILRQFDRLQSIRLHGLGEPLTNPNLSEMVSLASSRKIKVDFTTNATLLTSTMSSDLIKSGLSHLTVSLDGATPETYETIRVGACFETVIENLLQLARQKKLLNKLTPFLSINTVITNKNIMDLPNILRLAKKVGAIELRASLVEPCNNNIKSWIPDRSQWIKTAQNAKILARQIGIKFDDHGASRKTPNTRWPLPQRGERKMCAQPWLAPFIRVDGYITPCCNISDWQVLGGINVFESDFHSLWNSEQFIQFRRHLKQGPLPSACQHCPLA